MELKHVTRNLRIAPRKLRLVTDQVKHLRANEALAILPLVNKRGALVVQKSLKAAVEAAKDKNLDVETLLVQRINVDEGTALKRMIGHSRGRMSMIMKKYSHLNIVLTGEQVKSSKSTKKATKPAKVEEPAQTETQVVEEEK